MEQPLVHYEFINGQTETVIGYLALPADMDKDERTEQLKKKQAKSPSPTSCTSHGYIGGSSRNKPSKSAVERFNGN